MLQQTTVAAVIPFFERWMRAFPDVWSLAAADEESVLKLWEGLGYYSRARNLLRAAREIVASQGGRIPSDPLQLCKLPGIGPYTASAIAAFAFDHPVPVLDANVLRVVARLRNFQKAITNASGRRFLEQSACSLLPEENGCLHASALMELGALICKAGRPDCPACPVKKFCLARNPEKLPLKAARKPVIHERDLRVFARKNGRIFLVPSTGPRWKGLWLLPPAVSEGKVLFALWHTVTRHKIRLEVFAARPRAGWQSFDPAALPPMPSPHRLALSSLLASNIAPRRKSQFPQIIPAFSPGTPAGTRRS